MKDQQKNKIIHEYDKRFHKYGYHPKTLGWGKARHRLRYRILLNYWKLAGHTVLDYGCGFGDMFGYCQSQHLDVNYSGIDINPTLIREGKRQYPAADLSVRDPMTENFERTFDITLASGLFNTELIDNTAFIHKCFALFSRISKYGFAANFLSSNVDYKVDGLYYSDPKDILELAYSHSRKVALVNNYMPFEFTIFVDLRNSFSSDINVFEDHLTYL